VNREADDGRGILGNVLGGGKSITI